MKLSSIIKNLLLSALFISALAGCKKEFLEEVPKDSFSPENAWMSKANFELALNSIYATARGFIASDVEGSGFHYRDYLRVGTDVASTGQQIRPQLLLDFSLLNATSTASRYYWDAGYKLIYRSNTIIYRAGLPAANWANNQERDAIIAEAKFMRAYTYYTLLNLFGDVPLITEEVIEPRYDYTRTPKNQVLDTVRADLEFASANLTKDPDAVADGKLTSAAADQLLATVYLQLNQADKAVEATTRIISSGKYQLMTNRFGDVNRPGDVFSDLFWDKQQNRKSGNRETIWVLQFQNLTIGGGTTHGMNRSWGPAYFNIEAPDGKAGFLAADSIGRPIAFVRGSNYFNYQIWQNDTADIRNSKFNIRREWYYNNPATSFNGKRLEITAALDTFNEIFPMVRKSEGVFQDLAQGVTLEKDWIVYRFAETYLLRAEAYLKLGNLQAAADDLNVVRNRANAAEITAADVTIEFILDERARELIIEEPRRITLNRLGLWFDRTKQYSIAEITKSSIQPFHTLMPIPQSAIDINLGAALTQNPGY